MFGQTPIWKEDHLAIKEMQLAHNYSKKDLNSSNNVQILIVLSICLLFMHDGSNASIT